MLFGSAERTIGRGQAAEGQIDLPLFALFCILCGVIILGVQYYFENTAYTIAAAVSVFFFVITFLRVEWGIYILTIAMMLAPEVTTGGFGRGYQRTFNIRYDDILIVIIFLGVLLKTAYQGQARIWRPNPINIGIIAYYSVCLISTLLAFRLSLPAWDYRTGIFVLIKMLEFYLVFWTVSVAIDSRKQIRKQLIVFFTVSMAVAGYGIYSIGALNRVSAPFEVGGTEPNTLGGYLTLVICLALGLMICAPRMRHKLILLAVAATAFYPFLYTLSRASYLALLAGLLALGLFKRQWWLIGAVAIVLLFSGELMPEDVRERVNHTFQESSGVPITLGGRDLGFQVDKSTYERIYVWQKVLFNLRFWPWFGGGIEWGNILDSQYARVIIETGLFGITAFLFLQWRIFKTLRQSQLWAEDWLLRGLGLGASAALLALIVHSFGTISFLIVRIMEPFWLVVALAVVGRELALREHRKRFYEKLATQQQQEESPTPAPTPASPQTV